MSNFFKQGRDLEDLAEELTRVICDYECGHNVHHRADVGQLASEIATLANAIADGWDREMLASERQP